MTGSELLSGWGRYPRITCRVRRPDRPSNVAEAIAAGPVIARGAGCGYGDCALQESGVVATGRLDKFLSFDPGSGVLVAEAGVTLKRMLDFCVPRGFFPAVTPGTKLVTLGGMIAADVHGKNHHRAGSFGDHVLWLDLLTGDGEVRRCSAQENSADFDMTLGGMGLTGIVLRAAFRLVPIESAYVRQTLLPAANLDEAMSLFERHSDKDYSVAWIDCLTRGRDAGRSILMLGEHAGPDSLTANLRAAPCALQDRRPVRIPVDLPAGLLNRSSAALFNRVYYWNNIRRAGETLVDLDHYFYPLDALCGWNRIYGPRGFLQFQCVLPVQASRTGLGELLDRIAASGHGPFLAVLKLLGPGQRKRPLSFPIEGYTLALDFPRRQGLAELLSILDAIVRHHGGRHYLAKDAHIDRKTLDAGYGSGVARFRGARAKSGADQVFRSALSERLEL